MIIRFLDAKENCFQVDTRNIPTLVCLTDQEEVDYVKKIELGGCLISVPKSFDEETTKKLYNKLNTKDEPKNLK